MADIYEECQKIRAQLKPLSDEDKLLLILVDTEVSESIVFSTGGGHLSFITKDWDGKNPPDEKEVLFLTDGPESWIRVIMNALEIGERGNE